MSRRALAEGSSAAFQGLEGAAPGARPPRHPAASDLDPESREWLARLRSEGADREAALGRLRELLLRAARSETHRRCGMLVRAPGGELDDLAQQAADDALVAILGKLDDFRGESRFTTWAYKFALLEAGVRLRRRAWQDREVPVEDEAWRAIADVGPGPEEKAERGELLGAIREVIDLELSPHQRAVLVALAVGDVPIDVLAERLGTSRGALYKTLHDARRKLRVRLAARGLDVYTRKEVGR